MLTCAYVCTAGDDPDRFSVAISWNGFFGGLHEPISYNGCTIDFFDNCHSDTWSILWIHDFLNQLGIEIDDRLSVYWCLPYKQMTDGLVCIESDEDIVKMIIAAKKEKTLDIIVDHGGFIKVMRPDMILNARQRQAQEVRREEIALADRNREEEAQEGSEKEAEEDSDKEAEEGSEKEVEEETESEFYDSDYDAEDGDDDIFDANVDKEVNDYNEEEFVYEEEDDAGVDHEDLQLTKEQEQELNYKFSVFNPEVDMENPQFKAGMVFSSMAELRKAIKSYSIKERRTLAKPRNEAGRIHVVCVGKCTTGKCTWFLKASEDNRKETVVVRKFFGNHRCQRVWEMKALTPPFLADYFIDEFRDNQKMDIQTFAAKILRKFNMTPKRWKLRRARKRALLKIHGDEAQQFNSLCDFT